MSKKKEAFYAITEYPQVDDYPGCCGIDIINGFEVDHMHGEDEENVDEGILSESSMHKALYKHILDNRSRRNVQVALVSKYKEPDSRGTEQIPGFIDFLVKEKKWKVLDKFVNPNHGNQVTVLSKTFAKNKEPKSQGNYVGYGLYNW